MAESEEQCTPVEVEEDEEQTLYKPPEKKSVDEILNTDADDESLQKYKRQLLGDVKGAVKFPEDPRNVIIQSMTLISANGDCTYGEIDLTGDANDITLEIPEGCEFKVSLKFYVQREIVSGMKYVQKASRKGIKVDSNKYMVGSYGPKLEIQTYNSDKDEAPKGMLGRGTYQIHSLFQDDDQQKIKEWKWNLKIKKAKDAKE